MLIRLLASGVVGGIVGGAAYAFVPSLLAVASGVRAGVVAGVVAEARHDTSRRCPFSAWESLTTLAASLGCMIIAAAPLHGLERPDFSGVWRLVPEESQMIGGGSPPSSEHHITWLIDHRDPEITVVVNVRDPQGSREYAFRCTTNGSECVNELESLREVRRMTAIWEGSVLVMSQRATTPQGDFDARDRLSLFDSGERLIFERVVTNERGDRRVRQVFRKLGPHPSQRPPPEPLPSVERHP